MHQMTQNEMCNKTKDRRNRCSDLQTLLINIFGDNPKNTNLFGLFILFQNANARNK